MPTKIPDAVVREVIDDIRDDRVARYETALREVQEGILQLQEEETQLKAQIAAAATTSEALVRSVYDKLKPHVETVTR